MLPFADNHTTRRVPIITWLLIAVNVLVFVFELQLSPRALDRFMLTWGLIPHNVLTAIGHPFAAASWHTFATLLTSMFIHAGWLHIVGNMLFLLVFGDDIEERMGSLAFLGFYLLCGLIAGLVQVFALSPFLGGQYTPTLGASGAIAGTLGAYLVLYPTRWITVLIPIFIIPIPLALPAFVMIGWWFVQQLFYGVMSLTPTAVQSGGVAFWAHVGGFIAGMLFILPYWWKPRQFTEIHDHGL